MSQPFYPKIGTRVSLSHIRNSISSTNGWSDERRRSSTKIEKGTVETKKKKFEKPQKANNVHVVGSKTSRKPLTKSSVSREDSNLSDLLGRDASITEDDVFNNQAFSPKTTSSQKQISFSTPAALEEAPKEESDANEVEEPRRSQSVSDSKIALSNDKKEDERTRLTATVNKSVLDKAKLTSLEMMENIPASKKVIEMQRFIYALTVMSAGIQAKILQDKESEKNKYAINDTLNKKVFDDIDPDTLARNQPVDLLQAKRNKQTGVGSSSPERQNSLRRFAKFYSKNVRGNMIALCGTHYVNQLTEDKCFSCLTIKDINDRRKREGQKKLQTGNDEWRRTIKIMNSWQFLFNNYAESEDPGIIRKQSQYLGKVLNKTEDIVETTKDVPLRNHLQTTSAL